MGKAQGLFAVQDILMWLPPVVGSQAVYAIGFEVAGSGGSIQTIADELTAPAAVSFSSPVSESGALALPDIRPGDNLGLWIRKVFPAAGTVATRENMKLAMKFKGA